MIYQILLPIVLRWRASRAGAPLLYSLGKLLVPTTIFRPSGGFLGPGGTQFETLTLLRKKNSKLHTVEPVLSGTVLSGQPLLSGHLSKARKLRPFMYCNFDLY